jgi:PAS domain S-box-containing protein
MKIRLPSATTTEQWPRSARALLGFGAAVLAVGLTFSIVPFRALPFLLPFPTVILSAWYLGMVGGVSCALTCAVLVDFLFINPLFEFSRGDLREELRLAAFLLLSILLSWTIRKLAQQRAQLDIRELCEQLKLATVERQLAEERARAGVMLREKEDLLQVAQQANGMGFWVWDLDRNTIYRSDEIFRMVGSEPGSFEREPESWLKFVHPDDVEGLKQAFAHSIETGGEYHKRYRVVWDDGSERWLESQGKCQRNSHGKVIRILGVMADVTHRIRAEEAMLQAEKLAVAGRLAASVAHEINNPLEAVTNLLYLVGLADTTGEMRALAGQALEELMRVSQITQQTLKFHRQGGVRKVIKLSESFEALLEFFRARIRAAEVEVEVRAEHENNIACVPGEIQQIFANLLTNAIEAMPPRGRLVVRIRPSRDWRDHAVAGMRTTFCDSGVGMDKATKQRMFDPFFTTKIDTGTGLGMWVVSQLVERHKGHIRVWSTQRVGRSATAFSIFLPFGESSAMLGPTTSVESQARSLPSSERVHW